MIVGVPSPRYVVEVLTVIKYTSRWQQHTAVNDTYASVGISVSTFAEAIYLFAPSTKLNFTAFTFMTVTMTFFTHVL